MRKKSNLTRIFEIDAEETFTTEVSAKIWTELATKIGYTPEMIAKTLPIATAGTLSAAEVAARHAKEREQAAEREAQANKDAADDKEEESEEEPEEEAHSSDSNIATASMKLVMLPNPEPPVIAAGLYFSDDKENVLEDEKVDIPAPAKKSKKTIQPPPPVDFNDVSKLADHPGLDQLIYDILYGDDDFDDFDDEDEDFLLELDSDAGLMGGSDTFFMRFDIDEINGIDGIDEDFDGEDPVNV